MTNPKLTHQRVRHAIERKCGRIDDKIWQFAVDERIVSEVIQRADRLDWAVGKIRRLQEIAAPSQLSLPEVSRRQRRLKRIPARAEAISLYVAEQARREPRVQAYRTKFLRGKSLSPEQVAPWIVRQTKDHPYRHAVIVRLPAGAITNSDRTLERPLRNLRQFENLAPIRILEYARFGDNRVQKVPAPRDGPLGPLYDLAALLAEKYGWQKAQAAGFVLTDLAPEIEDCRAFFETHGLGVLGRIHMVIDPYYSPAEVAKVYQQVRASAMRKKVKNLSEKHTTLGLLLFDHTSLDKTALTTWNQRYPHWAYTALSRFRKEAKRAHQRLQGAMINHKMWPWREEPASSRTTEGITQNNATITRKITRK